MSASDIRSGMRNTNLMNSMMSEVQTIFHPMMNNPPTICLSHNVTATEAEVNAVDLHPDLSAVPIYGTTRISSYPKCFATLYGRKNANQEATHETRNSVGVEYA
jgi:hypothetical protein